MLSGADICVHSAQGGDEININRYRTLAVCCLTFWFGATSAEPFEFVALGDTAYCPQVDNPRYERLIELINAAQPSFSIHLGDTGAPASGICIDAVQAEVAEQFASFAHPVVYTPGDNEWTDCTISGSFRRLERLRSRFFSESQSLGSDPMPVIRQSDESEHQQMVENVRWEWEEVLFATLHVVGSQNGLQIGTEESLLEFHARTSANVDWIHRVFEVAREDNSKAMVIAFHADMYREVVENSPGYTSIKQAFREETADFDGKVLFINGDSHELLIDKPLVEAPSADDPKSYMNVTRLVVYGDPDMRTVRVTVEPDTPWVFGFVPLYEEGDGRTAAEQRRCSGG